MHYLATRSRFSLFQTIKNRIKNNARAGNKRKNPYPNNQLLSALFFSTDSAGIKGTIPVMGKGVKVGQYAELERVFTIQDVDQFGSLVNDTNFLHRSIPWNNDLDRLREIAPGVCSAHLDAGLIRSSTTINSGTLPLVHGMLVSSIFSSIFASLVPGCVYVNQNLNFVAPVFCGQNVVGRLEIEKIRKWRKGGVMVQCDTQVLSVKEQQSQLITGVANVWLPEGYPADDNSL